MKRFLFIIFPVIDILVGCSGNDMKEMLSSVDSLCMTNPDSALKILDGIDRNGLSSQELAHYCFVYTKSQDKADIIVKDDSLIRIAYDYYRQHSDEQPYAQTMYYMGKYYANLDSTKQSEDCLLASIKTAKERKEYYTAYLGLGKLGRITESYNANTAIQYTKESLLYYKKNNNNIFQGNIVRSLENLGRCYMYAQYLDSAIYTYNKALQIAIDLNDSDLQSEVLTQQGWAYTYYFKINDAIQYAQKALNVSSVPSESLCFLLYYCYGHIGKYDKANQYLSKINFNNNYKFYVKYLNLIGESIYKNDTAQAYLYRDSLTNIVNQISAKHIYTNGIYINDNIKKSERIDTLNNNINQLLYGIVIILLSVIIIGMATYYHHRDKIQKKQEALIKFKNDYKDALENLANSEKQLELLKKDTVQLLDWKKKEIENLHSKINDMQRQMDNMQPKDKLGMLMEEQSVKLFAERLIPSKNMVMPTDSEWSELINTFGQYLPKCHQKICNSSLSYREEQVSILTRLKFETKECATLLNTTMQVVTNTKISANKKLFSDTSAKTLYSNLKQEK